MQIVRNDYLRNFLFYFILLLLAHFFSKGREIGEDDDEYSGDEASSEESSVFDEKAFEEKLCDPSSDIQIEVRFSFLLSLPLFLNIIRLLNTFYQSELPLILLNKCYHLNRLSNNLDSKLDGETEIMEMYVQKKEIDRLVELFFINIFKAKTERQTLRSTVTQPIISAISGTPSPKLLKLIIKKTEVNWITSGFKTATDIIEDYIKNAKGISL